MTEPETPLPQPSPPEPSLSQTPLTQTPLPEKPLPETPERSGSQPSLPEREPQMSEPTSEPVDVDPPAGVNPPVDVGRPPGVDPSTGLQPSGVGSSGVQPSGVEPSADDVAVAPPLAPPAPAPPSAPDPAPAPAPDPTPAPAPAPAPQDAAGAGAGMLVLGAPSTPAPTPPAPPAVPDGPPCTECGGRFGVDGYCEQCGSRRPNPRHHYEQVAPEPSDGAPVWVGGVCDRGIRHVSNEDALAVYAESGSPRRAALVVCDGVSTARRSSRASQAAADAALAVLASTRSRGLAGVASALVGALGSRLDAATDAAAEAVLDVTHGPETDEDREDTGIVHLSDPACTFVAAVVDGGTAVVGSVGDSRGYWLPDGGAARLLTRDDSWSEEQIALGVPREVAETAPQAHSITRWLGPDAPDHTPAKTTLEFDAPGWLLLCSDGLWNYASEPEAIGRVVAELAATLGANPLPVALARRLVEWANAQGGRDNITVALARIDDVAGDGPSEQPATQHLPVAGEPAPEQHPTSDEPMHLTTPQEGPR